MSITDQPATPMRSVRPHLGFARFIRWETLLVLLLIVTSVINAQLSAHFLNLKNFSSMAVTFMPAGLVVLSMTFVILIAGIDLSVASILGLSAVVMALLFHGGVNIWIASLGAVLVGGLAGLVNGMAIAGLRMPSLIVTLATLAFFRGLAYGLIGEDAIYGFPTSFVFLGRGYLFGSAVPMPIAIFAVFAIVFIVILHRTTFGRTIYAVGNNASASRYSGLAVDRLTLILFVLSGVMCALGGIIMSARFDSARGDTAAGMELDVITAVLLGGVSVFGGKGTMLGPIIALFLIGEVRYGMDLQNLSAQEQTIANGTLLIVSVLVNELLRRNWSRRKAR